MCEELEERYQKGFAEGKTEVVLRMIARGKLTLEKIAEVSGFLLEKMACGQRNRHPVSKSPSAHQGWCEKKI